MELVLLAVFFVTLGPVASQAWRGGWMVLWLIVLAGTLVPLAIHLRPSSGRRFYPVLASLLVLLGAFALRTVVVFSAQG